MIVAAPKDVILSTIPVAPEVPPVNVSPVVNAPEAAPKTLRFQSKILSHFGRFSTCFSL